MSQETDGEAYRRNRARLKSLLIRSIIFAVLGVAFIWLPTVDMLARQVALAGPQVAATATTGPGSAEVQAPEGGPAAETPVATRAMGIGSAQIGSSILASCGIVALVALNYFLRRRRSRQ